MRIDLKRLAAAIVAVCCVLLAVKLCPWSNGHVSTEDTNHDGRPDVWRLYNARGELSRVTIDTNFDGRPDRVEQYERGALVSRASDRNFDSRTDLFEEFDVTTQELVRSVADNDYDGYADLLVLFRSGQPVHWESLERPVAASSLGQNPAGAQGGLAPLEDLFRAQTAFRRPRPMHVGNGEITFLVFAPPLTPVSVHHTPLELSLAAASDLLGGAAPTASILTRGPPSAASSSSVRHARSLVVGRDRPLSRQTV